ncbi:MAG: pyruvate formate lyase-activating protein [Lachnospiraceae bacterium]|nr:pyruvate formate lyase-activating protein [Clostridiales bacterium]MBP3755228.1 pyruvate formate lyase-activating protein [Lachnospiraceae bacterium]
MIGKIHSLESFGTVDGPGTRFVVFTKGCPMRCLYCHNPDTWDQVGATEMEPKYILEQYHRNESFYMNGGGITVTGGEPLVQIDFVTELFELCKKEGIHTCLDTSGIMFNPDNPEMMAKHDRLVKVTDLVMLDIKHIDNEHHKKLTSQPNTNILKFAFYLQEKGVDMWIRHVVVPGWTDDDKYLYDLGYFLGQFHNLRALDALPYHDMGKVKYEKLGIDYPLKDVKPMDPKVLIEKKKVIIEGIKKRRAELTEAGEDFSHK